MRFVAIAAGSLLALVGLRSVVRAAGQIDPTASGRERVLLAVHEAARSGFWLSLAAFFIGYEVVERPRELRWFVLVPIGMAGVRLAAATVLARRSH